jgi:propionyl-CoA carboxylase alpha chain
VDGVTTETRGHISSDRPGAPREVWVDSPLRSARLREVPRFTDPADAVASGSLLAPMPGTVVSVKVEPGAEVAAGEAVLVLEAMKMQHTVTAPHDGTVTEINVEPGAQVASGEVLAVVATEAPEEHP